MVSGVLKRSTLNMKLLGGVEVMLYWGQIFFTAVHRQQQHILANYLPAFPPLRHPVDH